MDPALEPKEEVSKHEEPKQEEEEVEGEDGDGWDAWDNEDDEDDTFYVPPEQPGFKRMESIQYFKNSMEESIMKEVKEIVD